MTGVQTCALPISGAVEITRERIEVNLKKKRNLPAILTTMEGFDNEKIRVLDGRKLHVNGESRS